MLFSPILRVSPRLPQRWTYSLSAGRPGAEGCLWGWGILPSGCRDRLVRKGPCSVKAEGGRSAPQGAPERSAVEPQTQPRQDLHGVGFLLRPGLTWELWETVYMQRFPSVPESAHQKELHPDSWRWEESHYVIVVPWGTTLWQETNIYVTATLMFVCLSLLRAQQLDVYCLCWLGFGHTAGYPVCHAALSALRWAWTLSHKQAVKAIWEHDDSGVRESLEQV